MREPKDYEAPLCAEIGGDWWFPEKEDHPAGRIDAVHAKSICGGLSEKQRRVFRRRRRIITRQEGRSA